MISLRRAPKPSVFTLVLALGFLSLFILVIYPVVFVLFGSFSTARPGREGEFTLQNYVTAFTDVKTMYLMINTLVFAFGSATFAVVVATFLSIVAVRTNTPLRGILVMVPFLPLILPGMVDNLAWIYLFSPRTGLLNVMLMDFFRLESAPFNIYSMVGMVWSMGMSLIPSSFLVVSAAMRTMDPSLEDAARVSGSGIFQTFQRVTLPLTIPAIFSIWLLQFIHSVSGFETPSMIGSPAKIDVFMASIYQSMVWTLPPEYGLATARATIILVITMLLVYIYRKVTRRTEKYQIITGKGYRPNVIDLGRWKYVGFSTIVLYVVIHIGLLFSTVILLSLQPFWNPRDLFSKMTLKNFEVVLTYRNITNGFVNSVTSSFGGATLAVIVATFVAYVAHKTRMKGRGYVEAIGMLPISIPGLVLGVGLLWAFLTLPLGIWGTPIVIILAFLLRYLPFGIRTVSGSVIQIHRELEEASKVAGADTPRTMRSIIFPLLKPALLSAWIYIFISSFKALGEIILLTTPQNEVLATALWDLWINGNIPFLAAASVLLIIVLWTFLIIVTGVLKIRIR